MTVADEIRELHSSNKTKHSHKDTKHTRNKKAREVTLCLGGDLSFTNPPGQEVGNRNYVFNFNSEVFCCDDITVGGTVPLGIANLLRVNTRISQPLPKKKTANPEALGQLAYTCSWIERAMGGSTVAVCHGLLDMNTAWHKKDNSVAAFTFMVDTAAFATMSTGQFTPLASAVTGTTGAWGKADNIQGFYLDVVVSEGGFGGVGGSISIHFARDGLY